MDITQDLIAGKNALWLEYSTAHPLVRNKIIAELKAKKLQRHWLDVASKEGHDLKMAKLTLVNIFLKHMPETAPLFGVTL